MLAYSQSVFYLSNDADRLSVRSSNFDSGWVDPTDPEDLSRARLEGIAQHLVDDWTKPDRPIAVAPLLGLRHSRLIRTDYTVTMDDLVSNAHFSDSVGETETIADTHSVDFEFESDELAFYYSTCRGFRNPLVCQLPYRMLLPRGLSNVWIACRAAGAQVDASYGLRMQRDMQRLGEAAGLAAAQAAATGVDSRGIDLNILQAALDRSGARQNLRREETKTPSTAWLGLLDRGIPGVHLWNLSGCPSLASEVSARLGSDNLRVSFYAAALLAMWGDPSAEQRLLQAVQTREEGPSPKEFPVDGAWGQCIDFPFWLQAILLLRRCATAASLPVLRDVSKWPAQPLNVRTFIARTLEKLATSLGPDVLLLEALDDLLANHQSAESILPPSRSLWRTLHDEEQVTLGNDRGADTSQDHSWQLHLVIARTRQRLGLNPQPQVALYRNDPRGFVRLAFKALEL